LIDTVLKLADDEVTYDPESGRPFRNGKRVLGLTDVLKLSGLMDGQSWGTDLDLWMGQCRHKAVELWVRGTLDLDLLDPEIRPSLEAFLEFQKQTGFVPSQSEFKVFNPLYHVATRIDLLGKFPDGIEAIIELKSGTLAKTTAIQTSGQDILLGGFVRKRFGLSIPSTGKPKIMPYTNRDDYIVFRAALTIAGWKVRELGSTF